MIKILQVIGTLHIGGAETVAMNLFRYIDRSKVCMDYLVYDNEDSPYIAEVERMGGKVIRIFDLFDNRFSIEKKLYQIFMDNGPYDAIHAHLMFHNGFVLSAAKKANINIRISHAHTNSDGKKSNLVNNLYRISMRRKILKNATKLVACSNNSAKYLYGKEISNSSFFVLNNRVNASSYRFNLQKYTEYKNKYFKNQFNIIIVGHLIPLKNHIFILKVFKELIDIDNRYSLTIIGDGELKEELKEYVNQLECKDKISFTGNITNVNEYMLGADFLVMPSIYEGLPITLIEAQAAGLSCLVSDNIDDNVNITGLIKFLPIDKGVKMWVNELLELKDYTRRDTYDIIRSSHYDVSDFNVCLEKIYNF